MANETNTYTVTIADAHSHSVSYAGIPASSKQQAAYNALASIVDNGAPFVPFVGSDTWTITITQP